jgi:flagellar biosynthesis protein FlhG
VSEGEGVVLEAPHEPEPVRTGRRPARLISVGGGKGGVGKSFLVANLAVSIARAGHRVVAVDADLEGPNLHTCLGVRAPATSLADFAAQRVDDVAKLVGETSVEGLQLIAGTHSKLGDPQPDRQRRVKLMQSLRGLDTDYVLLDLGAGSEAGVLDYFLVGDEGLVVLAPEPTSVENAYTFLRAAFYRRLRLAMLGQGARDLVNRAMDVRNERGIRTPLDLLREVESVDSEEASRFVQTMRRFRPRIVVNQARTAEDVRLGFAVCSVCRKHFGFEPEYLGYVNYDEAARKSVSARTPVVDFQSNSDAAIYLQRIARKLVVSEQQRKAAHEAARGE